MQQGLGSMVEDYGYDLTLTFKLTSMEELEVESGDVARWYLEVQKRYAKCQHPCLNNEPEVKIT